MEDDVMRLKLFLARDAVARLDHVDHAGNRSHS
jgi:hypothetical protein